MTIKGSTIRGLILDMLKSHFGGYTIWQSIEVDLAMLCADLPEATSEAKKDDLIKGLRGIKQYLIEKGVEPTELTFLDEEIERYEHTKQMSLYEEAADEVSPDDIDRWAKLSYGTEGVVAIHLDYTYEQLKKITNGVYKQTGLVKFYVSREKTIKGKIVAEIYEHPQKIPIATLIESRKIDKETGEPLDKRIAMFGEKINGREYIKLKEVEVPLFVYRFISEHNQELILLTFQQQEIGDYLVTGVTTQLDDWRMLTDSAKLPTKLPYMFAHTVRNRIIKFQDHGEFRSRLAHLEVTKKNIWNIPFTVKKAKKQWILLQPRWFKWLIWSWLLHSDKGLFNSYPLHLLIIGPKHSGKSLLLNALHARGKESRPLFSGSSSTLKHLVPSFKYNPARLGYLAESNRFSYCDEFLRCLVNTRTTKEGSQREEGVAIMNDLLEHQKRQAGSGVSQVNVNMTSRIIATTNPIREVHCVADLIKLMDESFLSRWLIYYQTDEHVEMVRDSKDTDLKTLDYQLNDEDWISILDYLHTLDADYDMDKVEEVYNSVKEVLSEDLRRHYDARHKHHIECIMDGIVKARCLFDKDMTFKAKEDDYNVLKDVWSNIIRSWIDPQQVRHMPIKDRIRYLPENCQHIYFRVAEMKRPVSRIETEEIALQAMKKREYTNAMVILLDNGILIEDDGFFRPHWMSEVQLDDQQRL